MSDKSFGDHINRNVVKNSLLSSAVVGLSLEDLTHKAVLLPATPSQGQVTRVDQAQGSQTRTLAQPDHDKPSFPSGDAFSKISLSTTPSNILPKRLENENNTKFEKNRSTTAVTQSKASAKPEDDFDVNEYIARLQGTRYVSAPLHSHLKEDHNSNLEAEESLEEINLNESRPEPVQQSLTADIAQNFSQLPAVLPHVASAVFSSFSNMLNMKREQTPEKSTDHQEVQFERPDAGVPLVGVEETLKDFGLPPKEPPTTGVGSYRIASKKKYAQIPGLSHGGAVQNIYHNPNIPFKTNSQQISFMTPEGFERKEVELHDTVKQSHVTPFMTPEGFERKEVEFHDTVKQSHVTPFMTPGGFERKEVELHDTVQQSYVTPFMTPGGFERKEVELHDTVKQSHLPTYMTPQGFDGKDIGAHETVKQNTPLFTPVEKDDTFKTIDITGGDDKAQFGVNVNVNVACVTMQDPPTDIKNTANVANISEYTGTNVQILHDRSIAQESNRFTPIDHKDITIPRLPIIPPPPMFSNLPRSTQQPQTAVGKSVLPPSVARRISANQPLIKQQATLTPVLPGNIFVPTIPESSDSTGFQSASDLTLKPPHQPFNATTSSMTSQASSVPFTPEKPSSVSVPFFNPTETVQQNTSPFFNPLSSEIPKTSMEAIYFTPSKEVSQLLGVSESNIPPTTANPSLPPSGVLPPSTASSSISFGPSGVLPPNSETEAYLSSNLPISNKSADPTPSNTAPFVPMFSSLQTPQAFFNPQAPSIQDTLPITQIPSGVTPEPAKPLVEPPKATGLNFRMTKKRPQYYSGPIEGVGAISNNVKPTIAPVIPSVPSVDSYQGFFTPEQPQTVEAAPSNMASVPFDISKPVEPAPYVFKATQAFNQPQSNTQEYSTAFDLSRTSTDAFEPPKQEAKGFGIIGSLKSKLSSIDINKIQSTVTTFFDPAYNDAKGEPALETAPYAQQQYGQQSHESNFEISVPSVQQNQYSQFGYQQGYSYNQSNQYYQAQNAYNYQSEGQNASSYYTEPNYSSQQMYTNTQEYASATTQENIPQNVEIINHNVEENKETQGVTFYNLAPIEKPKIENIASIQGFKKPESISTDVDMPYISPNVGSHGAVGDLKTSTNAPIGIDQAFKHTDPVSKSTNFFDKSVVTDFKVKHGNVANAQTDSLLHFSALLPPATSFFDSPVTRAQEFKKSVDIADEMEKLAMAEEIAIGSLPLQAIDLQIGTSAESKVIETNILKGGQDITTIALDKNVQNFHLNKETELDTNKKGISLVESLSKGTTPVVAVSSVPLFGLSAIIDKSKETPFENDQNICLFEASDEIIPILENQSSFSFFENITAEHKVSDEANKAVGLSISDVKNVLLMEPPQKTASLSLFKDLPEAKNKIPQNLSEDRDCSWNLDTAVVTSTDNVNLLFDRKASGFFNHSMLTENLEGVQKDTDATEKASDFNICETCREVKSPEIKDSENVTNQLIENINSSIQLSNAVEVSLTENIPTDDRVFDDKQFDDISRITEETIETLQGQSAVELLDNVETSNFNYGWKTEQLAYASIAAIDQDFVNNPNINPDYNTAINPEYTFKIDPNATGFFGDNSLFFDNVPKNASDEIKAELKTHEDIVLPKQMSIPSAPPAEEDDSKSDETGGLDVLSIEQDAKKDFPLEEEFIIEPSETDDDKIEFRERKKSSEDSMHDTFADRIEKFKIKAGAECFVDNNQKSAEVVPPKSMASYFDTGNYAVETHYRKSLTSPNNIFQEHAPTNILQVQVTNENVFKEKVQTDQSVELRYVPEDAFRLPPGFEDELRRQFMEQTNSGGGGLFIPETSTQTHTTTTATFHSAHAQDYFATDLKANEPAIHKTDIPMEQRGKDGVFNPIVEDKTKVDDKVYSYEAPTLEKAFGSTNTLIKDQTQALGAQIDVKDPAKAIKPEELHGSLLDPMNFFSQAEETKGEPSENYSRLASYFSMPPPQPEHSKSFFELSQSQNHYRHVTNTSQEKDRNIRKNLQSLMQDLTSTQNIKFDDNIVKTVNYFSVEYNNVGTSIPKVALTDSDVKPLEKNLDSLKTNYSNLASSINSNVINDNIENDEINTINTCEYCCNIKLNTKEYKVRTAADTNTRKEGEGNMDEKESNRQRKSVTVDFGNNAMDEEAQDGVTIVQEGRSTSEYSPVRHHWFYRVDVDDKSVWRGFSTTDSNALERKYLSSDLTEDTLVPTDGGRFDVNIIGRMRVAVYWKEKPTNVRRCSWFYKGTTDARYVPYTEAVADKLEEEYRHGVTTGEWHRRLVLPNSELVVMHGPAVMVHFLHGGTDSFSSPPFLLGKKVYRNPPKIRVARELRPSVDHLILVVHGAGEYKRNVLEDQSTSRPRVVRRGYEESEIEDSEPSSIDHLLLLCHGVGSACDMRFRSVEEVVEDFRSTSLQLLQSHYRSSYDNGIVSRVEVLPISWHAQLHVGEGGVDMRLNKVTLESIPRLRAFTNHTVLDALFYTSPVYHQTIIETVCFELNRIYNLFKQRNPDFKGGVSLGGHSLGSVILYDLLCHQTPEKPLQPQSSSHKTYLPGTCQPLANYPQLQFSPAALYALGSPIAIFECIRGVEALGKDFALPTCKNFFNIFHPYDPIAYRIEPLINPLLQDAKPFLIPHHKGRKRMHLELKDTMVRVGADLKQKLIESLRTTWNKWKSTPPPDGQLEKVVEEELEKEQLREEAKDEQVNAEMTTPEMLGKLNCGRRIDYVLQEAPLEMINEYLFAMSSHVGYWESEDTMLLMLREIYSSLGVQPDCSLPQQTMTLTRPKQDEATIVNEKEYPSTSHGSTS